MSSRLFDWGRDAFLNAVCSWANAQKAMLCDLTVNGAATRVVTAASNANPVVYTTSAAHGYVVGDVVAVGGVVGNLSANQTGIIDTVPLTTTFTMKTLEAAHQVAGSGAYVSGGYAVNLTAGKFVSDLNAGREGVDIVIGGTSSTRGVATSSSFTWLGVPVGNPIQAVVIYDNTGGSDAARRVEAFVDGKIRVVVDKGESSGVTTIRVEPLKGPIPNGTVINWSDGTSCTTNAVAAMGDRTITVTATAATLAVGATADVTATSAGLPVTPNGGNITFTVGTLYGPGGSVTPGFTVTGIFELLSPCIEGLARLADPPGTSRAS